MENTQILKVWKHSFIYSFNKHLLSANHCKGKHSSCASSYSRYCVTTSLLTPGFWFSTLQAIPQHELDVLQFSSIHLKSLPGDSVRSNRVRVSPTRLTPPTSDGNQTSRFLPVPLTNWLYKSEDPTTPSLGLVTLLEWLTQLREAFCLHLPVYYKRQR